MRLCRVKFINQDGCRLVLNFRMDGLWGYNCCLVSILKPVINFLFSVVEDPLSICGTREEKVTIGDLRGGLFP